MAEPAGLAANAGLTGAFVNALAIDPSAPQTIYAGMAGGVFKTTNGGASWTPTTNATLANSFVNALAIDASAPATDLRRDGQCSASSRAVMAG